MHPSWTMERCESRRLSIYQRMKGWRRTAIRRASRCKRYRGHRHVLRNPPDVLAIKGDALTLAIQEASRVRGRREGSPLAPWGQGPRDERILYPLRRTPRQGRPDCGWPRSLVCPGPCDPSLLAVRRGAEGPVNYCAARGTEVSG